MMGVTIPFLHEKCSLYGITGHRVQDGIQRTRAHLYQGLLDFAFLVDRAHRLLYL